MKTLFTALSAMALVGALTGCSGMRPSEAHRYFVLESDRAPATKVASAHHDSVLLIAPPTVASFYDTQEMAYSRSAGQLGYYQYSSWAEPPGRRLQQLLATDLGRRGAFRSVAVAGSGVRGQLLLATHLEAMVHDATSSPGTARVAVVGELIDLSKRSLIARRTFSASTPVTTYDAAGAAQACGGAMADVLAELVDWVEDIAS
jgi:cholesterol transport system auxiliary component